MKHDSGIDRRGDETWALFSNDFWVEGRFKGSCYVTPFGREDFLKEKFYCREYGSDIFFEVGEEIYANRIN